MTWRSYLRVSVHIDGVESGGDYAPTDARAILDLVATKRANPDSVVTLLIWNGRTAR